ncbi:acylglycerol kinase family protein [Altererythrobacter arenosus]|uniref:Acylglycerol kinase family protein n=1 Tax=Altererythrobacter arenosus TaxID=3032592 RepID=A0ABY8FUD8_9SPHN|nr:acylglycerol kinase family protein [Altererythrobacter sp. CAU 1644]WFL78629.1 acylglycerol kinase family protein [Altererythrobacter sp. CAU 1644]
MEQFSRCCLITNSSSGSNRQAAVEEVKDALAQHEIEIVRAVEFPEQDLPTGQELDAAGLSLVVVFTGDGSVNSAISQLADWTGAVLVLPGGTMNLLSRRLHRDFEAGRIIELVAGGAARRVRPNVCQSRHGFALAGLLVGPGTCWSEVREATRDMNIPAIAETTVEAIGQTAEGPPVAMIEPRLGRPQGYQLVEITPGEHGLQFDGFYADTPTDYARQGWAVLRRKFREGPHDRIGMVGDATLQSADETPLEMLIDGEPIKGEPVERFLATRCPVDLLATAHSD